MTVTEEEGGRLNAFAKEPRIQVIAQGSSENKTSRLILVTGALLIVGLILLTVTIS